MVFNYRGEAFRARETNSLLARKRNVTEDSRDSSSVEIFINNGEGVMSNRIFPIIQLR